MVQQEPNSFEERKRQKKMLQVLSHTSFTSSLVSPGNNTSIISDSSKRLGRRCNLSDTLQLISDCTSAGELPYCLHLGVATGRHAG